MSIVWRGAEGVVTHGDNSLKSVYYYLTCVCMSHRGQSPPHNGVGTLSPSLYSVGGEAMVTFRNISLSVSITA